MAKIRGMLLTLGVFLLVIPVLIVSVIIHNTYLESEEKIVELGKIERINELDRSVQDGFKAVLNEKWGINITANQQTSTITINENLATQRFIGQPGPSTALTGFENFVEGNYPSSPRIDIPDYVLNQIFDDFVVFVKPYMAVYKHDSVNKEVTFTPEKHEHIKKCGNPCLANGYKVIIDVQGMMIAIDTPDPCTGSACLKVEIEVWNTGGLVGTANMYADPEATSKAIIHLMEGGYAFEVQISKPAKLTVKQLLGFPINRFSIDAAFSDVDYPYGALSATLQENLINTYLEDLGTVKTSTAVIS